MDIKTLLRIIQHPGPIQAQEIEELQTLVRSYPYFQIVYTLLAKHAYEDSVTKAQRAVELAAVYAPDRGYLKSLLEGKVHLPQPCSGPREDLHTAAQLAPRHQKSPAPCDFINSHVSQIHNRAKQKITKTKGVEQLEIIKKFIRQRNGGAQRTLTRESKQQAAQVDLTQATSKLYDELVTESLAEILVKQGKLQSAIDMYTKLALKFPEKSCYFSQRKESIEDTL
ncbi:MAG: hypothetical protein AAF706_01045 [Bacteroidota bacterium]